MALLRASGQTDLSGFADGAGVPAGDVLVRFVEAALHEDADAVRDKVVQAVGRDGMVDAAAVIGGFDGITRIADATGIPVEPAKAESAADFVAALGIGRFRKDKV